MKKLLILDGNSIINRAYYGIRLLSTKEGIYTNGIYGFLNIFLKCIEDEKPDYVTVAFDLKAPTFRHKMYELYKAQRKGMPDELAMQMPILKEVLTAMNVSYLELEGFEADDIIGTVARICEESQIACTILSGDKDDLQLASEKTKVLLTTTRMGNTQTEPYYAEQVKEKYGVTPTEFIDVKALMGDASDNIPGVSGIGEKTAFSLIASYHSIEYIFEHLSDIELKPSVRSKLEAGKDIAELSKKLATIDRNVPLDFSLENYQVKPYQEAELYDLFTKLEFKVMIQKLGLTAGVPEKTEAKPIVKLEDFAGIDQAKKAIIKSGVLYYYLFSNQGEIDAILLSDGEAHYYFETDLLHRIEEWKDILEAESIRKIGYHVKENMVRLAEYGITLRNVAFDIMLGGYILNPSSNDYTLASLSEEVGIYMESEEEMFGKGKQAKTVKQMEMDRLLPYGSNMLTAMECLYPFMKERMEEQGQSELYFDMELPLSAVLADMEQAGFQVDRMQLERFREQLGEAVERLTGEIYREAGKEFNILSPKQLGTVLFEDLNLPVVKKTKTGYSTNAEVLEKLRGKHPIVDYILEYRQLAKLKSTYADGLLSAISSDGKIHSVFTQTVTTTGRISSTEPNLQNIPVRLELGREVRRMFTASSEEYTLIGADYSQIELRVLAHISGDPNMKQAFLNEEDIHQTTASQVFNVPMDLVTPLMRSRAKAVNFGIVYGIGDFSLAQDLHITRKEAKEYIDQYLLKYSKVKEYMTNVVLDAKEQGYVTTLFGRRRYIPELKASNFAVRSFGERVALNTPIQGTAADIIKIAMVRVFEELKKKAPRSRLILQVHDELIVEAHQSEAEQVTAILKQEMEHAAELSVPLTVNINQGRTWYDTK